jgi:hypothetical protein
MAKPDVLIVDGHGYSWRRLYELHQKQPEAWKKAEGKQPALFELRDDCETLALENAGPFLEWKIRRNDGRATLMTLAEDLDLDNRSFFKDRPCSRYRVKHDEKQFQHRGVGALDRHEV